MDNTEKFSGTPGFAETVFPIIKELLPIYRDFMKQSVKVKGLKIVFGSDALAGSHGRNAEEFVIRVRDSGVDPMAALVSANSLGAEALNLGDQIGSIAPFTRTRVDKRESICPSPVSSASRPILLPHSGLWRLETRVQRRKLSIP